MNSLSTQIPYDFIELNICKPDDLIAIKDNFGDRITGVRTYQSNYVMKLNHNEYCKSLCMQKFSKASYEKTLWAISNDYTINWNLDGLLSGYAKSVGLLNEQSTLEVKYSGGIPLGFKGSNINETFIYNHYRIYIGLHHTEINKAHIVSFNIEPLSLYSFNGSNTCDKEYNALEIAKKDHQPLIQGQPIAFTYDVIFHESNITFNDRFKNYQKGNHEIHWLGFINSNVLVVVLTTITICIFIRAIRNDIEIYNVRVTGDEIIDEYGWKEISNDVFRKPKHGMTLCALFGTGAQILIMVTYTLFFSVIGIFRPEASGTFLTMMIMVFIFMGIVAGYCSGRLFKAIQGRNWVTLSLVTSFMFPSICFTLLTITNFMFNRIQSSVGLAFQEVTSLILLWLCCSIPLVVLGTFIGIKQKNLITPGKINPVPTVIPPKPWFFRIKYSCWMTGILPFGAIFVEVIYLISSIWKHEMYSLESFAAIALIILIVTTAETSVIFVYLNLCRGDYNWWWKCYATSISPALYVGLYAVYYCFTLKLAGIASVVVYAMIMILIVLIIVLICGTCGIFVTFAFLNKIYSMLKVD